MPSPTRPLGRRTRAASRLRGAAFALACGGVLWLGSRVIHRRPVANDDVVRLRENAAMMVAGIDADRRSIALAQAAGDSLALQEAESSLRRHTARLAADIAALTAAGDRTAHTTLASDERESATPSSPTRVAVRP